MGVNPVGNVQKYFTFDGETSKKYNTHITGRGVYDAPVRDVEMITIPNRNGEFALDRGHFNNIQLKYEASIVADTPTEFSAAVSDLRNWLCSKTGYVRLEDDYNPNEYRMAVYRSGLDVDPFAALGGTFEIVFDCKPQRFLTSGETAVSVASGGTLNNPTLFESKPQIQVKGYGNIDINGSVIEIENVPVGNSSVSVSPQSKTAWGGFSASFVNSIFATGDVVSLNGVTVEITFSISSYFHFLSSSSGAYTNCSVTSSETTTSRTFVVTLPEFDFTIGTSSSSTTSSFNFNWSLDNGGGSGTSQILMNVTYDGNDTLSFGLASTSAMYYFTKNAKTTTGIVSGFSSKTISDTIYIDLDIGDVWATIGGNATSLNNVAKLPAELPVLVPNSNTITYDNTFTSLKVVPRWWKV